MQLYFIRHEQSKNNALWGQNHETKDFLVGPGLTDIGRRQTELLADHQSDNQGFQYSGERLVGCREETGDLEKLGNTCWIFATSRS